jgi:Hemerythrin HHE cation binding domain
VNNDPKRFVRTLAEGSSVIRDELLDQHSGLLELIERTSRATQRWIRGEAAPEAVHGHLARLAEALRTHNAREEDLLRGVLTNIDAWGHARAEIMGEEHIKEHHELYSALLDAAAGSDARVTERHLHELRERMLAHMAREEEAFLREDVLRADAVSVDSFSG